MYEVSVGFAIADLGSDEDDRRTHSLGLLQHFVRILRVPEEAGDADDRIAVIELKKNIQLRVAAALHEPRRTAEGLEIHVGHRGLPHVPVGLDVGACAGGGECRHDGCGSDPGKAAERQSALRHRTCGMMAA